MNKLSRFLVIAIAVSSFIVAFSQRGIKSNFPEGFLADPMLKPGETVGGMVITTGAKNAIPLWAFCSSTKENDHSISVDCGELSYGNLAIGHTFGVMELVPRYVDWEELIWEMSLDGHPIDLEAFGVSQFVYPDVAPKASRIREVFRIERLWNLVLVNPTPGMHRLQGQAQSRDGAATYTWDVNFTVATPLRLAYCLRPSPLGHDR